MDCAVRQVTHLAGEFYYVSLEPAEPLGKIRPGQFVMIRVSSSTDPFLRRPMSVADFEPDGSRFGLVVQVIGRGTRFLSGLVENDRVDALGPYGGGFEIPENAGQVYIVAGGCGVAPFIGLAKEIKDSCDLTVFLGARTAELLLYRGYFEKLGARVLTATEDGSGGYGGLVTHLLETDLQKEVAPEVVLTCGPAGMMRAVAAIATGAGVRCYASLENRMACGFGACLGCVTRAAGEDRYVTVCKKGPVFDVTEVEI